MISLKNTGDIIYFFWNLKNNRCCYLDMYIPPSRAPNWHLFWFPWWLSPIPDSLTHATSKFSVAWWKLSGIHWELSGIHSRGLRFGRICHFFASTTFWGKCYHNLILISFWTRSTSPLTLPSTPSFLPANAGVGNGNGGRTSLSFDDRRRVRLRGRPLPARLGP